MNNTWTVTDPNGTRYTCTLAWSRVYGDFVSAIYLASELTEMGVLAWLVEPVAVVGWDGAGVVDENLESVPHVEAWMLELCRPESERWAARRVGEREAA